MANSGLHSSFTEALERSLAFNTKLANSRLLPVEAPTCSPLTESQRRSPASAVIESESPKTATAPPKNVSQRLGRLMQNLFARGRKSSEPEVKEANNSTIRVAVKPVILGASDAPLEARAIPVSTTSNPASVAGSQAFQVRINGRAIAQLQEQRQAEAIAQRIKSATSQPDFDPQAVQLSLVEGTPTAKLGKKVLFAIDESIASIENSNRHLLAINWFNNLRVALGVPPLNLLDAQKQMYRVEETSKSLEGFASWYGGFFHGRLTANGETYNKHAFTAAHPSLPFDTYLQVTNLKNNNSAIVRINDRGPFIAPRTLDLSWGVSKCIDSEKTGVIPYKAIIMKPSSSAN